MCVSNEPSELCPLQKSPEFTVAEEGMWNFLFCGQSLRLGGHFGGPGCRASTLWIWQGWSKQGAVTAPVTNASPSAAFLLHTFVWLHCEPGNQWKKLLVFHFQTISVGLKCILLDPGTVQVEVGSWRGTSFSPQKFSAHHQLTPWLQSVAAHSWLCLKDGWTIPLNG